MPPDNECIYCTWHLGCVKHPEVTDVWSKRIVFYDIEVAARTIIAQQLEENGIGYRFFNGGPLHEKMK